MKQFVFLFWFIVLTLNGLCQIDGIYVFESQSTTQDYQNAMCLTFKDGYYSLELTSHTSPDSFVVGLLSFGQFKMHCSKILLNDCVFGYKMILRHDKLGNLKVIEGFSFMVDGLFSNKGSCEYAINDARQFNREQVCSIIENEKTQTESDENFMLGEFSCGGLASYSLAIMKDGKYRYSFQDILISEGTWQVDGNLVILKDSHLRQPLYAVKRKVGISGMLLPGASPDCILYNINY